MADLHTGEKCRPRAELWLHDLVSRARWLYRARRRAAELGIAFSRRATFAMPGCVHVNGTTVAIDIPDEPGCSADFISILLGDCYELELLRSVTGRSPVVVDIGANVGFFDLVVRRVFPDAVVSAYEPNPAIVPLLKRNVEPIRVVVHGEAVGGVIGWNRRRENKC